MHRIVRCCLKFDYIIDCLDCFISIRRKLLLTPLKRAAFIIMLLKLSDYNKAVSYKVKNIAAFGGDVKVKSNLINNNRSSYAGILIKFFNVAVRRIYTSVRAVAFVDITAVAATPA